MTTGPTAELDGRFSSEDANATPWADVVKVLQEAFWLSTLRAHHGHEHVGSGIDIVVEGAATRVTDDGRLAQFVGLWSRKYEWPWKVVSGGSPTPIPTAPSRTRNGLGGIRFNCWK